MTARRRSTRRCGIFPALLAVFVIVSSVHLANAASDYDPYKILGVSKSASQAEIKRAYKNLAREW